MQFRIRSFNHFMINNNSQRYSIIANTLGPPFVQGGPIGYVGAAARSNFSRGPAGLRCLTRGAVWLVCKRLADGPTLLSGLDPFLVLVACYRVPLMREVQIVIRDDFDGSPNAETITFGFEGKQYEVDLSDVHRKELTEFLQHYIEVARPVDDKPRRSRPPKKASEPKPDLSDTAYRQMSQEEVDQRRDAVRRVRRWARDNGFDVSSRSRVPNVVHDAYNKAHPDDQVPTSNEFTKMHRGDQ